MNYNELFVEIALSYGYYFNEKDINVSRFDDTSLEVIYLYKDKQYDLTEYYLFDKEQKYKNINDHLFSSIEIVLHDVIKGNL